MIKLILMVSLALLAMNTSVFAQQRRGGARPSPAAVVANIVNSTPAQFLASRLAGALEQNSALADAVVAAGSSASPDTQKALAAALATASANFAALNPGAPNPYAAAASKGSQSFQSAFSDAQQSGTQQASSDGGSGFGGDFSGSTSGSGGGGLVIPEVSPH